MEEKLTFENSKEDKLVGILSNPTDSVDVPIIILCHGFSSSKETASLVKLQKIFDENKIASFRFDFYGHGESEGKFEDITISEGTSNILKAVEFLKNKDYQKIGLIGSSFGGMCSLIAASRSRDLFVLALKSPVSDFEEVELIRRGGEKGILEWKNKVFVEHEMSDGTPLRLNYSFFEDTKKNNGYDAAEKIKIPTFIVHGDADETVPYKQSLKTVEIIEDCKLETVRGADHRYTNPKDFDKAIQLLADFIIEKSK